MIMDSAFETAPYPGYTIGQLRVMASKSSDKAPIMLAEIARRERVYAGDVSVMTAGERLAYASRNRSAA
jgi:hypothetical protein